MVGGRDYKLSQFNRTTQANRSVGSIIKPLMTMIAMDLDPRISPGCFWKIGQCPSKLILVIGLPKITMVPLGKLFL